MHKANVTARPLPYEPNASTYASRLVDLPGLAVLASQGADGSVESPAGRYDIVTALPEETLHIKDFDGDVAAWMQAIESRLKLNNFAQDSCTEPPLPFAGGAIGYLDYDSAAAQHGVKLPQPGNGWAGLYRWCIISDHETQQSWYLSDTALAVSTRATIEQRLYDEHWVSKNREFQLTAPFSANITRSHYEKDIAIIQDYINAGDCYQVNYAQRFSARYHGDTWLAFERLREVAAGNFSAFLKHSDNHSVLSLSPERFLSVNAGRVETQPIKGTRPRGADPKTDLAMALALQSSIKDRAENVMITDLLRNDLGRFCAAGTVDVPALCKLHSYTNVHHLVSTVVGVLRPGISSGNLLVGSSPGGSITGAPKRRAIEIIAELETESRGAYCGSVFVLSASGWLQSNIAIRTLEACNGELVCWGGGGITADSDCGEEYQETLDKVGGFMRALEADFGA